VNDFTCPQWHDLAMDFADHGDYCRKVGRAADSREGSPFGDVGIMVSHETVARVRRSLKKRARQADRAAVEESLD